MTELDWTSKCRRGYGCLSDRLLYKKVGSYQRAGRSWNQDSHLRRIFMIAIEYDRVFRSPLKG